VRTDPQIAAAYGRPDFILTEFADRMNRVRKAGDYFGVHSHAVRWHEERQIWLHDFIDVSWNVHCAEFALNTFAAWSSEPTKRFRGGAGMLMNEVVDALDRHGVAVDLTLEPIEAWPAEFDQVPTGVDHSPYLGVHTDCESAPQVPYHPTHADCLVPASGAGRDLVMIPMSTHPQPKQSFGLRKLIDACLPKGTPEPRRVLHLSETWKSAKFYWDLVTVQLRAMRRPYLSLAIRTDAPGTLPFTNARSLLQSFLDHPLSRRVDLVDPLDVARDLL